MSKKKSCPFPFLSREPLTGAEKQYAEEQLEIFRQACEKYTKENTKTVKAARKSLAKAGIKI